MIPVCALRDIGMFDNTMAFSDKYFNAFSLRERVILINALRLALVDSTPEMLSVQYSAGSIFPYGPLSMLANGYKEKLNSLRNKYGSRTRDF